VSSEWGKPGLGDLMSYTYLAEFPHKAESGNSRLRHERIDAR